MTGCPAISPVALERRGNHLRATLMVSTAGAAPIRVFARISVRGVLLDWQAEWPDGSFASCTTGNPELDGRILDALSREHVRARNGLELAALDRRLRLQGGRR